MAIVQLHGESALCSQCGYALTGLALGATCPECGTPSRARLGIRFADNLSDAPVWYLKKLLLGLTVMCLAMGGIAGLMGYGVYYQSFRAGTLFAINNIDRYLAGGFLLFGVIWVAGARLVTIKRPLSERTTPDVFLESQRLRLMAFWGQFFVPISVLMVWTSTLGPAGPIGWVLVMSALVSLALAAYAIVPLSVYLSSLADWAGDTTRGNRLRGAAWVIAVIGSLGAVTFAGALIPHPFAGLFNLISIYAFIFSAVAVLAIAFGVMMLAFTVKWAILTNAMTAARDRRLVDKQRAHQNEMVERSLGVLERGDPTVCSECGLDLSSLGRSGRCPECNALFIKQEEPWTPEDLSRGIPLSGEGAAIADPAAGRKKSKILHIPRMISKARIRYRPAGLSEAEYQSSLVPPLKLRDPEQRIPAPPSIDETLDGLTDDRSDPAPPPPNP